MWVMRVDGTAWYTPTCCCGLEFWNGVVLHFDVWMAVYVQASHVESAGCERAANLHVGGYLCVDSMKHMLFFVVFVSRLQCSLLSSSKYPG